MDVDRLRQAADLNLAAAWAALGEHAGFAVATEQTITLASSGLPIAFFNGAFTAAPVGDPQRAVAGVVSFYRDRGVPYLLWVRDGADVALLDAARAAGLRDAGGPPLQILAPIPDQPAPPTELHVSVAHAAADLDAHRTVVAAGFGMPPEVAASILGDGILDDDRLAVVVGRVDGEPVATALLCRTATTAGIYNVATVPAAQGRGYGAAVTWAAVSEGARRGCDHAVLQASEMGYPVYRRMGFADGGRYVQLEGPPSA